MQGAAAPPPWPPLRAAERCKYYEDTEQCIRESTVFRGDLIGTMERSLTHSREHFLQGDEANQNVQASLNRRALLLATEAIEGWTVSLSRWILQAATTSGETTHRGPARHMFEQCAPAIDPPVSMLVQRVRDAGVARRIDVARALVQCASHIGLWRHLVDVRNASVHVSNRWGWRPLHYAAALGAEMLVEELLQLGADPGVRNFIGATPLHVAVAHGSVGAASSLAAALTSLDNWTSVWTDDHGRSPADIAMLAAGASEAKCAAMLRTLQVAEKQVGVNVSHGAKARKTRCTAAIAARRHSRPPLGGIVDPSWDEACPVEAAPSPDEPGEATSLRSDDSCGIELVEASGLTTFELAHKYVALGAPVLIRGGDSRGGEATLEWLRAKWAREELISRLGDVQLPAETYPYASASAPLVGEPLNQTTLGGMLQTDGPYSIFRCPPRSVPLPSRKPRPSTRRQSRSTRPVDVVPPPPLSVFKAVKGWSPVSNRGAAGSGVADGGRRVRGDIEIDREAAARAGGAKSDNGTKLLDEWTRPAFIGDATDARGLLRTVSIQFYVGGTGAGAQPHWHGPAWNWLLRGRKRWMLWPPEQATYAQRHVTLAVEPATHAAGAPLVCEQLAGDVLVLPALWGHATLNKAPSIGFATELQFDRTFDLDGQEEETVETCSQG